MTTRRRSGFLDGVGDLPGNRADLERAGVRVPEEPRRT
jgi:hypothetical protein